MSVTKEQFHSTLKAVVDSRRKLYDTAYSFHWRWQDDDTFACEDGKSFTELVELMNFPAPETYVIPNVLRFNKMPAFELQGKIAHILARAAHDPGDSVVILHYSGHGRENLVGGLELCNLSGKVIAVERLLSDIQTDRLIALDEHVDVIIILDCCFAFLASRTNQPNHRRVDILCANEKRDPIAFAANKANSFTSKILVEARSRAQNGERTIAMSNLIEKLRETSPVKKPTYAGKLGPGSIVLPLVSSVPSVASRPPVPGLMATFSIHVSENFSDEELRDLVRWIGNLPKSKLATLSLEGIKKTNSMVFIFEVTLGSFYRIMGIPGVSLICENQNVSFNHILRPNRQTPRISAGLALRNLNPNVSTDENTKP